MNNKRCTNCGCIYNADLYGDLCPLCHSKMVDPTNPQQEIEFTEFHEEIPCVYGPPPIQNNEKRWNYPVIYGPSPVKKFSYSLILFIIGAILGGIIVWLLGDCSNSNQSTVYGPPPIDTIKSVSPK